MAKRKKAKRLTGASRMRARGIKCIPVYCGSYQHKRLKELAKRAGVSMSSLLLNAALWVGRDQ